MDAPADLRPQLATDPFPKISDYGVIGNLETVALVANTGAVEFFCYPRFDSPAIFAAMLDRAAGSFTLEVAGAPVGEQRYIENTNVLATTFRTAGGVVEVTDFMPIGTADMSDQLVRVVRCLAGRADVAARCKPAFNFARGRTVPRRKSADTVVFEDGGTSDPVRLVCDRPIAFEREVAVVTARLAAGERMVLAMVADGTQYDVISHDMIDRALADTLGYWRGWLSQSGWDGEFRDAVMRSALALKLMFSDANGSMVAAPTTSLPEAIGSDRNWDYRYCWMRDSAFTIYAMLRLGFMDEADKYRCFVRDRVEERGDGTLGLMYRLDGTVTGLDEETLDHLSGYRGSRPVRVGNAAHGQTQRDIYGEVIDTLYLADGHISSLSDRAWRDACSVIDEICRTWDNPGNGFWEMRGEPQFFLDALLMSWVGLDRGLRLAHKIDRAPNPKWEENRGLVTRVIEDQFFNPRVGAYTQTRGGEMVDAVALLMPLMKFNAATDERFRSTLAVIEERLVDGPFVRRYETDEQIEGLDGAPEGHFVACSFWYIEVLARSGRVAEARKLFAQMLKFASPVGLFSEEIAADGTHLGNTPQALSHLTLISAAVALSRAARNGDKPF